MSSSCRAAVTSARILSIALVAVTLSSLLAYPPAGAQSVEFVQILAVDTYQRELSPGESASYNWTLRSLEATQTLTVSVEGQMTGRGWSFELDRTSMIIAPGGLSALTATVHAPLAGGSRTSNLTLHFEIRQDGILVQIASASAVSSVKGAWGSADKVLGLFSNPLPSPLDNEWGVFLLDAILWLAIAFAMAYLMDLIKYTLVKKTATMIDDIIIGIVRTPILLLVFAFGIVQSLDALYEHIPEDIRSMIFAMYSIILVLVIFYLAYKLFKEILVYYSKMIAKKTESKIDDVLIPVVEKVGVVVIALVALGYVLGVLDVDLTMFIAGGVVVSMVLAFAAQETISNFFSGVFLMLDRPFAEGDMIILSDGDWCEVRRIGLRTTRLYRYDDASIVSVPNNRLVNEKIARMTNVSDPARVNVNVSVAYGTDTSKAREAIMRAIKDSPYSLLSDQAKQPMILLDEMGDSALIFKVFVWIKERSDRIRARDRLVDEIYRKLNEAGIEIPFPQRVIWMKKE
ncbi:MAG: mechanosensitive ion channel family protein [Thermoplasmata archaeon]